MGVSLFQEWLFAYFTPLDSCPVRHSVPLHSGSSSTHDAKSSERLAFSGVFLVTGDAFPSTDAHVALTGIRWHRTAAVRAPPGLQRQVAANWQVEWGCWWGEAHEATCLAIEIQPRDACPCRPANLAPRGPAGQTPRPGGRPAPPMRSVASWKVWLPCRDAYAVVRAMSSIRSLFAPCRRRSCPGGGRVDISGDESATRQTNYWLCPLPMKRSSQLGRSIYPSSRCAST
jgi:hypothetical protein